MPTAPSSPCVGVAERQPRVSALDRAPRRLVDRLAGDEEVDLAARHHHLPGAQVAEQEHVLGELALLGVDEALAQALLEQQAQLVLGVRRVADLARRRDLERPQNEVAHPVEEVDDRLGDAVEDAHERRHGEGDADRARDREALGRELAEHHVQERDDAEGEGERKRRRDLFDPAAERLGDRLEQVLEGRLGESAEADAGDRDAELAGGEIRVDVVDGVGDRLGATALALLELGDLARPDARDGELRRHEEAVEGDEGEGADDPQHVGGHRRRLVPGETPGGRRERV